MYLGYEHTAREPTAQSAMQRLPLWLLPKVALRRRYVAQQHIQLKVAYLGHARKQAIRDLPCFGYEGANISRRHLQHPLPIQHSTSVNLYPEADTTQLGGQRLNH